MEQLKSEFEHLQIASNAQLVEDVMTKLKNQPAKRLDHIHDLSKGKKVYRDVCGICSKVQPTINRTGLEFFYSKAGSVNSEPATAKNVLTAERVLSIFKRITDDECRVLGFDPQHSRPEWMMITCVCVAPLPVRPTVVTAGSKSQDDLTHKLGDIVNINNTLKSNEKEGTTTQIVTENVKLLQYHVATMIDNELPGLPRATQKSGRPIKSIKGRLKGTASFQLSCTKCR